MADSTKPITVYGHSACPMVRPVLSALDAAEAPYEYVDIRQDGGEGRVIVRDINNGNESVPTLVFPDGSTLTEPSLGALSKKLSDSGYSGESLDSVGARVAYTLRNPVYLFILLGMAATILAMLFNR